MLFTSEIAVKLHIITSELIAFVFRAKNDYSFYKLLYHLISHWECTFDVFMENVRK